MSAQRQTAARPAQPKIVLLLRLLAALEEGRYDFEALKHRVSPESPPGTRTLRRYLATLAEAGFQWEFDRATATYRFAEGATPRRLHLSAREVLGILLMRGLARSLGGELASSVDEATQKLVAVADRRTSAAAEHPSVRIHVSGMALDGPRAAAFELLQNAQRDSRTVRFSYVDKRGRTSERTVDPYGFVVSGGRGYLVGYDHLRSAKRVFALDGMTNVRSGARRFARPADFDLEAFAAKSISGIMHAEEPTRVTVRFSRVVANAAKADRVVKERSLVETNDGGVDITYEVADPLELVRWTLRWGAEAEVTAPPEVRAAAKSLVAAIATRYSR
ncbi:MAG: WYL domain-containing protein [Candidatus Eremiobacteraeota bacterium]|nr:WYL domain-containing protein [Candidatus Eremiobacteraeota bacterium]MBV9648242.1 WYL domain-containing protein [Candidatus Eremiobacteraeota bacterium]